MKDVLEEKGNLGEPNQPASSSVVSLAAPICQRGSYGYIIEGSPSCCAYVEVPYRCTQVVY